MEDVHMAGRHPAGPEYVEQLEGSELAKRRLRIVLETLAGKCGIGQAAELLGVSEQRVHQLREEALQAALVELEPKTPGRRPRAAADEATAAAERMLELEKELRASKIRQEIALVFPELVVRPEDRGAAEPEKKTTARPKRRARPGWWKK
jgi:hypothetical protein